MRIPQSEVKKVPEDAGDACADIGQEGRKTRTAAKNVQLETENIQPPVEQTKEQGQDKTSSDTPDPGNDDTQGLWMTMLQVLKLSSRTARSL